jgi:hypothetical protein
VQSRKFEGRNVQGSGSKKAFQEAPRVRTGRPPRKLAGEVEPVSSMQRAAYSCGENAIKGR